MVGGFDLDEQLKLAEQEVLDFSSPVSEIYWVDQDSALLDTTFSDGKLELIIIKRGYMQSWWALALRQLGQLLRHKMQNKLFPEVRGREYKKHAGMAKKRQVILKRREISIHAYMIRLCWGIIE